MRLRYAGTCSLCGAPLDAGATADYDRSTKSVHCVQCPPRRACEAPAADTATPRFAMTPDPPPELEVIDGVAGGSAVREFECRHDARQERVQAAHPKIGRFLLAVFDDPQTTRAWSSGAVGEQLLGETLAAIASPSLRVLHDRRIPRTTANIDHLVVCPTGVFVIDSKHYRSGGPELRIEGGLFRPRTELLYVAGRERTGLVEGMHKQLGLVRSVLADVPEVPVRGVLCFVRAEWPLIGGSFTVRDVAVLWPKKLKALLTEPGSLDTDRIADLQCQLHEAFPRQKGRPDQAGSA